MDGLAGAASVIAVIDIAAKITALCYQYAIAVKDAKNDIERVQRKVDDLARVLTQIKVLEKKDKARLLATSGLFDSLGQCLQDLENLKVQLEPGKTRRTIGRFGVSALKWPFTGKQVKKILTDLEGYEQTFTLALQVDQTGIIIAVNQKLDFAKLPTAKGASFNSHAEEHGARCLPDTRTKLLHDIAQWAKDEDGEPLFWLSGMAGTGKSTIARTVAQTFSSAGQLGASFFFKKGEGERGNASRFFSTIATDLVGYEPDMLPEILEALDRDPALSERALEQQFERLILNPLKTIQQDGRHLLTRIIVIDALDECEEENDVRTILQLLARTKSLQPVSLRIFVTSRPELHIRLGFRQMPNGTYQDLILHEVSKNVVEHDIFVFLEHGLGAIREARGLSPDWPAPHQILALVELAVPLFIFAATVCRYVGTKGGDPEANLKRVLEYRKSTFSQLDQTYLLVLDQLLLEQEEDDKETWLDEFRELVGGIVILYNPLSVSSLASLLQIPQRQIECRLDALHSILSVPRNQDHPVRPLHLSFRDFLVDPKKQGQSPFWVDERKTHEQLAKHCLELMSTPGILRRDICDLRKPGTLISEVTEERISKSLSPQLRYACRYWVDHLDAGLRSINDGDMEHLFLKEHLLHWLEAMSLMKESTQSVRLLEKLLKIVSTPSGCAKMLRDAISLLTYFDSIIRDAPLQIYSSVLTFSPETSRIRRLFSEQVPQTVQMLTKRQPDWHAHAKLFNATNSPPVTTAIAFSPDGKLVTVALDNKTMQVWDTSKGTCRSVLEGHSSWIPAIAFSPDGQLVASASYDMTLRLWKAEDGTCRSVLDGHPDWVTAVVFSPDGRLVASAVYDNTVWVWDIETETCRSVLKGHLYRVTAVAFSPDGKLIASASKDKTVRLWDATTGVSHSVLEAHLGEVRMVAFSPDGQLVASVSWDETIRLWDLNSGTCRKVLIQPWFFRRFSFSLDGESLQTDRGDIPLALPSAKTSACQSSLTCHILVKGEWILRNQEPYLWLPTQYRSLCTEVCKDIVGLGLSSGRVIALLKIE